MLPVGVLTLQASNRFPVAEVRSAEPGVRLVQDMYLPLVSAQTHRHTPYTRAQTTHKSNRVTTLPNCVPSANAWRVGKAALAERQLFACWIWVHTRNPSVWEAEAGGSKGKFGLLSKTLF